MNESDFLAEQFETHRAHLRGVAYRMLGSVSEADDAVQEAWLRLSRSDPGRVQNLAGWLTTSLARVCLDMLRARRARREELVDVDTPVRFPDPIVSNANGLGPEQEVLLADSVGLALLVVLETLAPPERLAFVLHDMFGVPFNEIAPIVERTPAAARQLASRARRRVQKTFPPPETSLTRQREIVTAWLAASRGGDFGALIALLDPDVVLRVDTGASPQGATRTLRGARMVAEGARTFAHHARLMRPVLVDGTPGAVAVTNGKPVGVATFAIAHGKIVTIEILSDPERLARLDLSTFD